MSAKWPVAALALVLFSGPSVAADATQDEADRIAASLRAYLGSTPGVITVVPDGASYKLTFDAAPLLAGIGNPRLTATMTPVVLSLSDQGDGKWKVAQDQMLSAHVEVADALDATFKVERVTATWDFDTREMAVLDATADYKGFAVDEKVSASGKPPVHVAYAIAALHYDAAFTTGDDGVSGTMTGTMTNLAQAIAQLGPAPVMIQVTADSATLDRTVKGLRSKALAELLAWFIAHPSPDAMVADQATAKNLADDALPFWDATTGTIAFQNVSLTSQLGSLTATKASFFVALSGLVAEGLLQEKVAIEGLALPPSVVPPWAVKLVPTALDLDFSLTGFDLATPARLAIANFDATRTPHFEPAIEAELRGALLPTGQVTFTLGPSLLANAVASLDASAQVTAGPAVGPSGEANVGLKGVDDLQAAIIASPPEAGLRQVAPFLVLARGLAKVDGDRLTWKVGLTPDGNVTVNGTSLSHQ